MPEEKARKALTAHPNSLDDAMMWVFTHGDDAMQQDSDGAAAAEDEDAGLRPLTARA